MNLTRLVHLRLEAFKGFRARPKGAARSVAAVIGILLSIESPIEVQANNMPLKVLANKQLTDKQYACHNEIVYRESRWNEKAIGNKAGTKQTHGYYQIKSKSVQNKPYDYQFWIYWYYVSKRYGLDYEIPDYCAALDHLIRKGWQ